MSNHHAIITPHIILYVQDGMVQGLDANMAANVDIVNHDVHDGDGVIVDGDPAYVAGMTADGKTQDYDVVAEELESASRPFSVSSGQ